MTTTIYGSAQDLRDVLVREKGVIDEPNDYARVSLLQQVALHVYKPVDALDNTTTAESMAAANPFTYIYQGTTATFSGRVMLVQFWPTGALTAHNTTYATINVSSRTSTGGSGSVIATVNTKITVGTGDWTAFQPVTIPVTAANAVVAAGGGITYDISKASTGVTVPSGFFRILIEPLS